MNITVSQQTREFLCLTAPDYSRASVLMKKLTEQGFDIVSLNPERQDLETFFVEKVKEKGDINPE